MLTYAISTYVIAEFGEYIARFRNMALILKGSSTRRSTKRFTERT